MAEYLILINEDENAYATASPEVLQQVMDAHNRFAKQVEETGGSIVSGRALQPTMTATSIRGDVVTDSRSPRPRKPWAATTWSRRVTWTTRSRSASSARHALAASKSGRSWSSTACDRIRQGRPSRFPPRRTPGPALSPALGRRPGRGPGRRVRRIRSPGRARGPWPGLSRSARQLAESGPSCWPRRRASPVTSTWPKSAFRTPTSPRSKPGRGGVHRAMPGPG